MSGPYRGNTALVENLWAKWPLPSLPELAFHYPKLWRLIIDWSFGARDWSAASQAISPSSWTSSESCFPVSLAVSCDCVTELWPKYMKRSDRCHAHVCTAKPLYLIFHFLSLFPHLPAGVEDGTVPISPGPNLIPLVTRLPVSKK